MLPNRTLTAIPGLRVGHAQDDAALTGCTVIVCEDGAVGGVDQCGGAPGTRETDLLRPLHRVEKVHAILLTGGSAFGLDAAAGVMRYLEERGIGFDVRVARVPIVPAAVIFDLAIGRADVRPDAALGYQACLNATRDPVAEGNAGAGTGATVGKIFGMSHAMKAGVGSTCLEVADDLLVGAIAVVNALGDVIVDGQIIAGARSEIGLADTLQVMRTLPVQPPAASSNTVIGVVATNARLTKEEANKVAQMAQAGLARAIRPAYTMYDGDTIFALSIGERSADINVVGAFAAEAFAEAIVRGARMAQSAGSVPGLGAG
jgi:L-aminopeptidase/D-esterase-like protein